MNTEFKQNKFRSLHWASILFLSLIIFIIFIPPLLRTGFKFQIDYNEGVNLFHSLKAASGQVLYDSKENMWKPFHYPPLSFYIIGNISKFFDNPLIVGRIISLLSLIFISVIIGYAVAKLGGSSYDAVFSSIFCIGLFSTYASHYVGMYDPQLLGHLFILIGFLIYLEIELSNVRLFIVAVFILLGLFTKHNIIAVPLAISIDLFLASRKKFFMFLSYCILTACIFIIATVFLSGHDFLREMILYQSSRSLSIYRLVQKTTRFANNLQIPIIVTFLVCLFSYGQQRLRIISLYFFFAMIFGVYFTGGTRVDINVFFDVFICVSIAYGIFLSYYQKNLHFGFRYHKLIYGILPIILSFGVLIHVDHKAYNKNTYFSFVKYETNFINDADFLENQIGAALCENILLCYFGKKRIEYFPSSVQILLLSGKLNEEVILERLESGYFQIVQLNQVIDNKYNNESEYGEMKASGRFTENILKAIAEHYVLVKGSSDRVFYLYKDKYT